MKQMTGEIGKLSLDGKAVGGFKYWTAIQNRSTLQTHVVASKFWLLKEIKVNKIQADFYAYNFDNKLSLVYSADVAVDFPEYEPDRMMSKTLDMNLGEFDWLQGLGR